MFELKALWQSDIYICHDDIELHMKDCLFKLFASESMVAWAPTTSH